MNYSSTQLKLINWVCDGKEIYDSFLKHNPDVVGKSPKNWFVLTPDISILLFTGDSAGGKDTYATAVIRVAYHGGSAFYKYDSGRINNDMDDMLQDCVDNIRRGWDLELWRRYAKEDFRKSSLLLRLFS